MQSLLDEWTKAAGIATGSLFRRVSSAGKIWGERVTEKLVWHVVKEFAAKIGVSKLAPHDLRRSCARLCRTAGGELEQIQFLLGHVSVQTTERYLGCTNGSHRRLMTASESSRKPERRLRKSGRRPAQSGSQRADCDFGRAGSQERVALHYSALCPGGLESGVESVPRPERAYRLTTSPGNCGRFIPGMTALRGCGFSETSFRAFP